MTASPPTTEPTVPAAPVLAAVLIEHHAGIPGTQITELRLVGVVDFYPEETP